MQVMHVGKSIEVIVQEGGKMSGGKCPSLNRGGMSGERNVQGKCPTLGYAEHVLCVDPVVCIISVKIFV